MTEPAPASGPPPLWALAVRQPRRPGPAGSSAESGPVRGVPLWREVLPRPSEAPAEDRS